MQRYNSILNKKELFRIILNKRKKGEIKEEKFGEQRCKHFQKPWVWSLLLSAEMQSMKVIFR
jgi:hypothetical protein